MALAKILIFLAFFSTNFGEPKNEMLIFGNGMPVEAVGDYSRENAAFVIIRLIRFNFQGTGLSILGPD